MIMSNKIVVKEARFKVFGKSSFQIKMEIKYVFIAEILKNLPNLKFCKANVVTLGY